MTGQVSRREIESVIKLNAVFNFESYMDGCFVYRHLYDGKSIRAALTDERRSHDLRARERFSLRDIKTISYVDDFWSPGQRRSEA